MKKYLICLMCLSMLLATSCKDEKGGEAEKKAQENVNTSTASKGNTYSPAFTDSFKLLLNKYYDLKDAFVKSDTAVIHVAADAFNAILPGFSFSDVKTKDSLIFDTVKDRPGDIQAGLATILKENDLEKKREGFEQVSQVVYDLLQTLKPNGVHAYYQYCPMAFNDRGAYWLSAVDSIMNPYFGKKMLTCGEVKEDLYYQ